MGLTHFSQYWEDKQERERKKKKKKKKKKKAKKAAKSALLEENIEDDSAEGSDDEADLEKDPHKSDDGCCTYNDYFSCPESCENYRIVVGADETMLNADIGLYL